MFASTKIILENLGSIRDATRVVENVLQVLQGKLSQAEAERGAARAEVVALKERAAADRAALDWAHHRINQLELDKAALFAKVTGVELPVAGIQKRPAPQVLNMPSFQDLGDEAGPAVDAGEDFDPVGFLRGQMKDPYADQGDAAEERGQAVARED